MKMKNKQEDETKKTLKDEDKTKIQQETRQQINPLRLGQKDMEIGRVRKKGGSAAKASQQVV